MAQNLTRHFQTIDRLMNATQEDIQEVEGIGPERAEILIDWFGEEDNRKLVEELRALGLRFEAGAEVRSAEGPLTGRTYVITGTLEDYTRDDAAAALEALGAKVANSVSGKTTGLIVGEEPGASKLTKAQRTGVALLDEAALRDLLASRAGATGDKSEQSSDDPVPPPPGLRR